MERLVQLLKGEEPKIASIDDDEEDIEADLEVQNMVEDKPTKPPADDSDEEDFLIQEI